jgi:acyl-CoA dehydrogenase
MSDVARFHQTPPSLGNQYQDDALLKEYLARVLPEEALASLQGELEHLGDLGGGYLYRRQLEDLENEPTITHWDAWGNRVDRIEVSPLWREAQVLAARHGLVATPYERRFGEHSRVVQFVLNYLVQASLDIYSCPLAMSDGAARTLLDLQNQPLIDRAIGRLTHRDPAKMWTSGQWMTERTGGSDVSKTETVARREGDVWKLYGVKWFTSAATGEMTLTLARPEGNPEGSRGLALFYLETKDAEGRYNGIHVHRLKDKLGTRKVPTAELTLEGAVATPVSGLEEGVRKIASMLNVTRMWNSMGAAWGMRRGIALARDYAKRRIAFGAPLSEKPLHLETLAGIAAEQEAGFLFAFRVAEIFGRVENGAKDEELLRAITPIAKLTTAKQAVSVGSEAIECFGGAGYVEDTGLPRLLADAQVLPIWEGTTNVLSLDTLRALARPQAREAISAEIASHLAQARAPELFPLVGAVKKAVTHAEEWLVAESQSRDRVEAGARGFALTLGRSIEAALLIRHAQWCVDHGDGKRAVAAARRFVRNGLDQVQELDPDAPILAMAR